MHRIKWSGFDMRKFVVAFGLVFILAGFSSGVQTDRKLLTGQVSEVASGLWRIRFGAPERFVPSAFREREPMMEEIDDLPRSGGAAVWLGRDSLPAILRPIDSVHSL